LRLALGDAHAVQELTSLLGKLDIDFKMSYADGLQEGESDENLILLGSADVNRLVERVQKKIQSGFEFMPEPMSLRDRRTGKVYVPSWEAKRDGSRGSEIVVDYGTITRTVSPLKNKRSIVILAGIYGYGTWSGVRVIADRQFHDLCARLDSFNLECLFRVEVLNDRILSWHIIELRSLPDDWAQDVEIDLRQGHEPATDDGGDHGGPGVSLGRPGGATPYPGEHQTPGD
jgi:hypothetical protein